MGQEILYCSRCQVRIVGTDFEKGDAYRVGEQVACNKCAMEMLATAPLAVQQQILDQKKRAVDRKAGHAPPLSRGLTGSSTAMRTPLPVRPATSSKGPLAALIGIGVMVAFLVIILLMSGGSPTPPPAPAPAPKAAASGPSPQ